MQCLYLWYGAGLTITPDRRTVRYHTAEDYAQAPDNRLAV